MDPAVHALALLDLPPGTPITVDGATRTILREDFVGLSGVPSPGFHLVAVGSAPGSGGGNYGESDGGESDGGEGASSHDGNRSRPSALHCTGLIIFEEVAGTVVARRFDPRTEELSSLPVDGATVSGLRQAFGGGTVGPPQVVPYDQFRIVTTTGGGDVIKWDDLTGHISRSLLRRKGLRSGDKVVPGCYAEDGDDDQGGVTAAVDGADDGISVSYPPIPCIERGQTRRTRHAGTKSYLSALAPSNRTALFLVANPGSRVVDDVLQHCYGSCWEEMVGDMQLSFLLFLHLGCLPSFQHWRDCISMLSLGGSEAIASHAALYGSAVRATARHLALVEQDFFQEVEYSGGNFLIPALGRLHELASSSHRDEELLDAAEDLARLARNRFGITFGKPKSKDGKFVASDDDDDTAIDLDMRDGSVVDISTIDDQKMQGIASEISASLPNCDDNDDDDRPVIISEEDIDASLARAVTAGSAERNESKRTQTQDSKHKTTYPLLFAAMSPHEDLVMTCARVLDEARDVSLVREASTYLNEVEAKRD